MGTDFFINCIEWKEYQWLFNVIEKHIEKDLFLKQNLYTTIHVFCSRARVNENLLLNNEIDINEYKKISKDLENDFILFLPSLPQKLIHEINFEYDNRYDLEIHEAYFNNFSKIKQNSSIHFVFQQAGKAYSKIYTETRLRDIYIPNYIDHTSIYYISIYMKRNISNYFVQKLTVLELAEGITKQMVDYIESSSDKIDFFKF